MARKSTKRHRGRTGLRPRFARIKGPQKFTSVIQAIHERHAFQDKKALMNIKKHPPSLAWIIECGFELALQQEDKESRASAIELITWLLTDGVNRGTSPEYFIRLGRLWSWYARSRLTNSNHEPIKRIFDYMYYHGRQRKDLRQSIDTLFNSSNMPEDMKP